MCGVFIYLCVCIVIFHVFLSVHPQHCGGCSGKTDKRKQDARTENHVPASGQYNHHIQDTASMYTFLLLPLLLLFIVYSFVSSFLLLWPPFFLSLSSLPSLCLSSSPSFSSSSLLSFPAGDSCPVLQSLYVAWATGEDTFPRQHGGHYHPVFLTVDKGCRPLHGVGNVVILSNK